MSVNGSRGSNSDDEEVLLMIIGAFVLTAAVGSAGLFWSRIVAWLIDQQAIVPAAMDPMVVLPSAGGAGLDLARVAVLIGVALLFVAGLFSVARRSMARRQL